MSVTDYTHFFLYKRSVIITELASSADRPESNQSEGPLGVSVTDWPLRTQKTSEKEKNMTHGSVKEVRCPNIIELLDIDHVLFYLWCCGDCREEVYHLPSLHVRGSTRATEPSSINPRSKQDPFASGPA